MVTIRDVSPTLSNAPSRKPVQFPTGRMLSVDSSDDGRLVFAGSFSSNLWVSENGGEAWAQVEAPQPPAGQFGVPGAIGGHAVTSIAVGPDSARWSVDRHVRLAADITGDGNADLVGFGDTGVWTALSNGPATFAPPRVVLADFGYVAGGWRVEKHPRFVDARGNIVGFGDAGVYIARSNGDGTFAFTPVPVINDFGFDQGWRVDRHPRVLADVTGDGRADIIGFGDAGVYIGYNNGDGTFRFTPQPVIRNFGVDQGWRVDRHPRFAVDVTGDGRADIVGFGDEGVWVALNNGDGTFRAPRLVLGDFGFVAGGWRVEKHPRFVDARGNIVGFGDAGVYVARSNGNGTFDFTPVPVINDFGFDQGWRVDRHPRFVDARGNIVGFGDAGVYAAFNNGNGTFDFTPVPVINDFGSDQGWRVDRHPRFVDARGNIIGFGDAGVYTSRAGRRSFEAPRFVLAAFGFEATVLALMQADRENADAGVWRSSDRGRTWARVHTFPRSPGLGFLPGAGQLVWAPGTGNVVYAAGGSSLAVSTDAGATFRDVLPRISHVAVAETPAGGLTPPAVYALTNGQVSVSFDAGMTWTRDAGPVPGNIGGGVGTANSQNDRVMVVSPRSPFQVYATGNANLATPELWRADYSQFRQTGAGQWQALPLPALGQQFSGNVFVAAPRPGHGDLLFYCPQRAKTFVAPLDPASAGDWHELDDGQHVHVDLHGIFLSPDFAATFSGGSYAPLAGTVWMASDGGIFRSTDGGNHFHAAGSISTLSTVNIAGAAIRGKGVLISLNTGDNDGFATRDGGGTWRPMDYGGGDNDCSFADPLRPTSMLVFTPRWNTDGQIALGGTGNTLALYETTTGDLPDISSTLNRRMIPGPALRPGSTLWNAVSPFVIRGYRPIVLNLPGDNATEPGDYVFIRFFGNFAGLPNNLAVLLRTRRLHDVKNRTDWDTPGGWRVEKHPRLVGDITADGHADIVGFGDAGVWTAVSGAGGAFADPRFVVADLGVDHGWQVENHPRQLADLTGDGAADIVGFGNDGVFAAYSNRDGTFAFTPIPVVADFGLNAGGWHVEKHPRFAADITGDGRADIIGFGDAGVYVALNNGDGSFQPQRFTLNDLGFDQGWRVEKHPRLLADLTGTNGADFVGFGDAGAYVAFSNGDGSFAFTPVPAVPDFGFDQGWRVEKHPRFLADVTGDGRADIVGFGDAGVYIAYNNGDGTFRFTPVPVVGDFGVDQGWRVDRHPRFLADVTGDGRADIVGFGDAGVYIAYNNGDGTFRYTPVPVLGDFGVDQGWRVDRHPRFLADLTGDGRADIVGFGDAGVLVAVNNGDGTFPPRPLFVIPNFGFGDNGPVEQQGPFLPDPNVGIVQAAGGHSGTVFYVGGDNAQQLWKWTEGMAAWQRLVPGGGATRARRFFAHPYAPNVVYLLDTDRVRRSDDGGLTWQVDASLEQLLTSGGRIPATRNEDDDAVGDHYDVILTDMQFDPFNPGRRFACGLAGAFMTNDGVTWVRLLDTAALRGRPANCFFDPVTDPADPALYVSFAGRSIVKINGFAPTPRAAAGPAQARTLRAMPDQRVMVTLEDGSSFIVDEDQL